ncbi:MAG TPA: hypothetical protein PJ994_13455, partial [Tepidiformaceae bacterium]|nr:hypothetical protein [Tepidiformaceae bacterium]
MTLALYGKSRRRQGLLVVLALFAVFVAVIAGTAVQRTDTASALEAGPNLPSVVNGNVGGFNGWSNSTNVFANNGQYATVDAEDDGSNSLAVSGFGFSIPPTATIDGITLLVEAQTQGSGGANCTLRAVLSWDAQTSFTAAKNQGVGSNVAELTFGGPTDTWGRNWSPSDFNNATFRVRLSGVDNSSNCGNSRLVAVDYLQVTVHYTDGPLTDEQKCAAGDVNACIILLGPVPPLQLEPEGVCSGINANFVIDVSGSVDSNELGAMKSGIQSFSSIFGTTSRYSAVKYASSTSLVTTGYVDQPSFFTTIGSMNN